MQRARSLLLMLALGGSHLAAVACPGAPSAEAPAAHADHPDRGDAGSDHGPHDARPDASPPGEGEDPTSRHHSDAGCRLVMTCGSAVLVASAPDLLLEPQPLSGAPPLAPRRSFASVVPPRDPPPPRLPV